MRSWRMISSLCDVVFSSSRFLPSHVWRDQWLVQVKWASMRVREPKLRGAKGCCDEDVWFVSASAMHIFNDQIWQVCFFWYWYQTRLRLQPNSLPLCVQKMRRQNSLSLSTFGNDFKWLVSLMDPEDLLEGCLLHLSRATVDWGTGKPLYILKAICSWSFSWMLTC